MARGVRFEITDEDPFAEGPLVDETAVDDQAGAAGAKASAARFATEARPAADEPSSAALASVPPRPAEAVAPGAADTAELHGRSERRPKNLLHSRNARRIGAASIVVALLLTSALGSAHRHRDGSHDPAPATPTRAASAPAPKPEHRRRRTERSLPTRHRHHRHGPRRAAATPPPAVPTNPSLVEVVPPAAAAPSPPVRQVAPPASPGPATGGEFTFER